MLRSKHSRHFYLGQLYVELTVVISAENLNNKAFSFVFVCLVKKPSNETKTK